MWRYRLGQGLRRLRARVRPPDGAEAQRALPGQAWALFQRMSPGDRDHCLRVYRLLRTEGVVDDAVLQAALLHDVGKAEARLTLAHRTVIVLLGRLWPAWLERLAAPGQAAWRRAFWVDQHHGELGAQRCAQAGCPAAVASLVRHHETRPDRIDDAGLREQVALLAAADDRC